MSECKKCGKVFGDIQKEAYATTLNNEVVYMCLKCYEANCCTINSKIEKDENYTKEADLPQDVIKRIKAIKYPISKFLSEVVYDSEASMLQWLYCCEANSGKTPKEHQDLLDKTKKVEHHPSLNEYQRKRIEAYLKSGLSIRATMKAVHADGFNTSFGTIKTIRKKISESVSTSKE
jgi:hypothetical protein